MSELEHGDELRTEACMCGGSLRVQPSDPMLPEYLEVVACVECRRMYEYDVEGGSLSSA